MQYLFITCECHYADKEIWKDVANKYNIMAIVEKEEILSILNKIAELDILITKILEVLKTNYVWFLLKMPFSLKQFIYMLTHEATAEVRLLIIAMYSL